MPASPSDDSPADYGRLRDLFERAYSLAPAEQQAFVQRETPNDAALRARLLWMLEHARRGTQVLGQAIRIGRHSPDPTRIGPYTILDMLGEGGMGTVYLAEQETPVKRRVALKLIKLGMDSKAVVARFEQERQALAMMDHDGIAKVFDCGTSDRGQPYFAMEFVQGIPLDRFCEEQKLSLKERLLLVQQVCVAVQHAHQKGVVHRDLKPGNVLVSDEGGRRVVKIIDFGLAKAMGQRLVEATLLTLAGATVGTPEYMAPEQADPSNQDIDTRADIWSLGVMLYQLLCGQLPFSGDELRRAGLLEMRRILWEVEPPKPSTKITTLGDGAVEVANARRVSLGALKKALAGDLDWVVLKALEKERDRRYETANALAADLQRYLDHEPLVAGPPSAAYRLKKLVRRYRGQVVAASAVLTTAVGGALIAVNYAITAGQNERLANQRAEDNAKLAREKGELALAETKAKSDALHQKQRADDKTREAVAEKRRADAKIRDFDQLKGVVLYKRAIENQEHLYPAWPHKIAALERWLAEDAGRLLAMRPDIERTVHNLGPVGLQAAREAIAEDRRSDPRATEMDSPSEARDSRTRSDRIQAGVELLADLEAQQFLHDTLAGLLDDLASLATTEVADVEKRLHWAKNVRELTLAHPNARHTWDGVRAAIASSPKYAGQQIELRDEDVLGLVPIGENPVTHLWEFYELRSACDDGVDPRTIVIPQHTADGSIAVTGATGIVFVLLPGGTFTMGAQNQSSEGPNFDPGARDDESPHEVTLGPFFLARHEMTQGQWSRMWTWNSGQREPSQYKSGSNPAGRTITSAHPVESVDWAMCDQLLSRHGMTLPSEAQWEYGCRGGTATPWIVAFEDLRKVANLADADAKRAAPGWKCESWSDGHVVHAPVGSFAANGFGLHDVHGNVWEWCQDWYGDYGGERLGDGLRPGADSSVIAPSSRCCRGSSFGLPAEDARTAIRRHNAASFRNFNIGVRPSRSITFAGRERLQR